MLLTSNINGVQFHRGAQAKLDASPAGTPVELVREPENRFDKNAILCVIDGVNCGYIPKHQAVRLAEDLDADRPVGATLGEGTKLVIEVVDKPAGDAP